MAVCFDKDSDPATRKITGLHNLRVGRIGQYAREYAPEMLTNEPYCPFKADVWYLGRMLNSDMDTEVRGFIEKQLKATREDASFDDVFGKYFAQDVLDAEYMASTHLLLYFTADKCESQMKVFEEYMGTATEKDPVLAQTTRIAYSLLVMIAQMRTSKPEQRPTLQGLLDDIATLRKSCSTAVLADYIGIQRRAVEWERR
ncbi:hypothetical protein EV421DRAFT_1950605 [Armillaria borealis]|uniref:Uncharacterized protein n=1 Tax=Armillaria borealis TaxID=47425 RepID=A0AA39JH99_9AGAR|nr:hypothetical protein EV421DRAFT_1950605 [Armillaria borealis]